jgi:hypothetical protein
MTATTLYVTTLGYPEPDRGPLQVLHSPERDAEADRLDDLERRQAVAGCDIFGGPLTGAAS